LRWRGDESLLAYARLNDEEWTRYVVSSYTAVVNSSIASRLAALGPIDLDEAALGLAAVPDRETGETGDVGA